VLEQELKETSILNPSDFVLTLLYITGFLILQIFSINLYLGDIWLCGKLVQVSKSLNFEYYSRLLIWIIWCFCIILKFLSFLFP